MAMTPKEMINFYGERLESIQKGLELGKVSNNYQLVAFNYRQWLNCKLMQGLITWRIEAGTPKLYLSDAVKIANEAVSYLTKDSSKNTIALDFLIEIASIISFLVDEPFVMPEYDAKGLSFDRLLSFEMTRSLKGDQNEAEWTAIINKQKPNKRITLCLLTYTVYRDLLFNKEIDETEELVRKAEELFLKRKTDSFYSGGEGIEGGGPDNDVTVDYHLAAILKYISYEGYSVHKLRC